MRIEKDQQLVTLLSMVFGLVFFITIASAADRETDSPPEKITIAYSSVSGHMAPVWIAHDAGFFRKYGLDVQPVFIESGSTTVKSLM